LHRRLLFVPQRHKWVDSRGSPRGHPTGKQARKRATGNDPIRQRIGSATRQEVPHQSRCGKRSNETNAYSDGDDAQSLPEYRAENVRSLRAERHANADSWMR